MTTREELHALIDAVPDDAIPAVVERMRVLGFLPPGESLPGPIEPGHSGHGDTSAQADEIRRETGFGE
jgi:hypothetical protein